MKERSMSYSYAFSDHPAWKLVDDHIGLISKVETIPRFPYDPPIFTALAVPANYRMCGGSANKVHLGFGASFEESKARWAALCESIERYCLEIHSLPSVVGTYSDLSLYYELLHPSLCTFFLKDQCKLLSYEQFTINTSIRWTFAFSLSREMPILVPSELVYLNYARHPAEHSICAKVSTGAACGLSLSDAIVRGICEVVERDAIMVMWLNRHPCPRIEIDTDDSFASLLQRRFRSDHFPFTLFWITNDIPIHTCLAIVSDSNGGQNRLFAGSAAHLDPQVAIIKALLEAHQIRYWFGLDLRNSPLIKDAEEVNTISQHALYYAQQDRSYLLDFLLSSVNTIRYSELANYEHPSRTINLQTCLQFCAHAGVEVIVADLTRDDIRETGLRVIRAIAPGMVPLTFRNGEIPLACSRIYEVPVRLGWRDRPIEQDAINRHPHPIA